jgi:2-methylcitrate dehydratase PrpD
MVGYDSREDASLEPTMTLSSFVAGLSVEAVPTDVLEAAKRVLLDSLGCGLAGIRDAPASTIAAYAEEGQGAPEATLWGRGTKVPAAEAALVLGTAVHAHGLDDVHTKMHVASVVVPAALTVAERLGANGRELLTAIVAGYEIMVRVGRALDTTRAFLIGWRPTSICGTFGAAAAAASLLGLDAERVAGALGLAGNRSSGLFTPATQSSVGIRVDPGLAAQSGVQAADLAARGVQGSSTVLESLHGGFWRLFSDRARPELATLDLGDEYALPSMNNKLDPVPMSLLSAVEAARRLHARGVNTDVGNVEQIILRTSQPVIRECAGNLPIDGPLPSRQLRAQLSAAYVLPSVLVDGAFTLEHLRFPKLADSTVACLGELVRLVLDPAHDAVYPDALSNTVEVHFVDGTVTSETVAHPPGSPAHPLSFEVLAKKYRRLAGSTDTDDTADLVVNALRTAEEIEDVRMLTTLLRPN